MKYLSVSRKYFAAIIDLCVILFFLWLASHALMLMGLSSDEIGGWLFWLLYEPILSSKHATIAQLVFSFRVRNENEVDKATLLLN